VYDACLQQETLKDIRITVKDIYGDWRDFTPPFTFIGCRSTSVKGKLVGTQITRLPDRPNFARIQTKVEIPVEVIFEDANGKRGIGNSSISVPKDVILFVPDESVIPFQLESTVNAMCVSGKAVHGDVLKFEVDVCITIILKIVAKVDLLVPSFGFCEIPPCEEFAENLCEEFFRLPLFPPQLEDVRDNARSPNPRLYSLEDEQEE